MHLHTQIKIFLWHISIVKISSLKLSLELSIVNPNGVVERASEIQHGAWWYRSCYTSNLNGFYYQGQHSSRGAVAWFYWKNNFASLKRTENDENKTNRIEFDAFICNLNKFKYMIRLLLYCSLSFIFSLYRFIFCKRVKVFTRVLSIDDENDVINNALSKGRSKR